MRPAGARRDNAPVTVGDVVFMDASSLPEVLRERLVGALSRSAGCDPPGPRRGESPCLRARGGWGADPWSGRPVWVEVEERDAERFVGTITHSKLDREGFRTGDRLSAPLNRIFDWVLFDEGGAPRLNEERARFAIGKRVLVGLTTLSGAGELVEQRQFAGRVVTGRPRPGPGARAGRSEPLLAAPDVRPLEEAPPGEYRLRSTGEVELDPDYLCTWTITRGEDSQAET